MGGSIGVSLLRLWTKTDDIYLGARDHIFFILVVSGMALITLMIAFGIHVGKWFCVFFFLLEKEF
jgi:hypothetical protein